MVDRGFVIGGGDGMVRLGDKKKRKEAEAEAEEEETDYKRCKVNQTSQRGGLFTRRMELSAVANWR